MTETVGFVEKLSLCDGYGTDFTRSSVGAESPPERKKRGLTAHACADPGLRTEETALHFCKIGVSFFLFQGDRRLLAFYESPRYPAARNPSVFLLGLFCLSRSVR